MTTLVLLLALQAVDPGQTAPPGLQQRPAGVPDEQHVTVVREGGKTVLPEDAYGLYRFADKEGAFGEGLQINEQFGEVSGYFSVSAGKDSHGRMSTYFLSEVTGGGGHLSFSTRRVHGSWYSFDGRVTRGAGLTRAQDGFYQLEGALVLHDEANKTSQQRVVSLKLTALH
jgi:hypothetical protein